MTEVKPLNQYICNSDDVGGMWNCVYYAVNIKGNPCVAPNNYKCEYKGEENPIELLWKYLEPPKSRITLTRQDVDNLFRYKQEKEALEAENRKLKNQIRLDGEIREVATSIGLGTYNPSETERSLLKRAESAESHLREAQDTLKVIAEMVNARADVVSKTQTKMELTEEQALRWIWATATEALGGEAVEE